MVKTRVEKYQPFRKKKYCCDTHAFFFVAASKCLLRNLSQKIVMGSTHCAISFALAFILSNVNSQ